MSKVSKKSAPSASKPSKPDVLTKVKAASVTKPLQNTKSKSKEVATEVTAKSSKKDKKNKKVPVKEPTPEPDSESEVDESEDSDGSSEEESDSEAEVKTNGHNGVKVAAKDESEAESSDESDSEVEAPKANGSAPKVEAAVDASESEDESDEASEDGSDESASEDETPAVNTNGVKDVKAEESEDEEEGSADDSADSSDDEESDEEEPAPKPSKRKADVVDEPVAKKSKVDDSEDNEASANLFVGNLSWNVDEEWLKQEFEVFGELSGVRLITNRDDGRSKGFGYVEFTNLADAIKAFKAKKGTELDNRPLNIDYAKKQEPREKQETRGARFGDTKSEPSDTLFLGNLSFEATEDEVYAMFSPFGTPSSVRIPTNPEDGSPKGFGYVTFGSIDEATAALEGAQGGYLSNRPVRLDFASSRPKREGDFGGRGGGRGGFGGRGGGDRGGRGGFGGRGRGRGGFDRGGRGGGRGRGFGDRGGRGGRGGTTNRGGFGDFSGTKVTF